MTVASPSLKISEIFHSLQGESSRVGLPTVFVRLTGCPLRCVWCDTEHAFSGGQRMSLPAIVEAVREPLAQPNCLPLLTLLCDAGFDVSLETSGAYDISPVDPRVARIVDLKAPGSGESGKNLWANLEYLTPHDELKLVLADRADYEWACRALAEHRLAERCPVLVSPVDSTLNATTLAEWVLADCLPVRFQVQLHKRLWGNLRGK